jgi:hypothetical protein
MIVYVPGFENEVVHSAALFGVSVTFSQPVIVFPFEVNSTDPWGEAPPLTIALKVTAWPTVDGFELELLVVVGSA